MNLSTGDGEVKPVIPIKETWVGQRYKPVSASGQNAQGSGMSSPPDEFKRTKPKRRSMSNQAEITIKELSSTWGCAWVDENGKTHYGFKDCPVSSRAQLWLECASGDAVKQLISAGLAIITEEKGIVNVNISALETTCDKYWDRANAQGQAQEQQRKACHYCGQPASKTGFFGEATCGDCS